MILHTFAVLFESDNGGRVNMSAQQLEPDPNRGEPAMHPQGGPYPGGRRQVVTENLSTISALQLPDTVELIEPGCGCCWRRESRGLGQPKVARAEVMCPYHATRMAQGFRAGASMETQG